MVTNMNFDMNFMAKAKPPMISESVCYEGTRHDLQSIPISTIAAIAQVINISLRLVHVEVERAFERNYCGTSENAIGCAVRVDVKLYLENIPTACLALHG